MVLSQASALLEIHADLAVQALKGTIQKCCLESAAAGVLLGLSGGIDSVTLATLAAVTLGGKAVHAIYLYDRDSAESLGQRARMIAGWLGIDFNANNIQPALLETGIYSSSAGRATSLSPYTTRLLHGLYRLFFGEMPFMTSLRLGQALSQGQDIKGFGFRRVIQSAEEAFNVRHRYRRKVLEQMAEANDWLLLGAANRTEWLTGWFVKGGVDDLPVQPLKGLYKTQIRQLAAYLKIPHDIIAQAPSPDMAVGLTDEFALGMPYARVDLALDHLAGGLTREQVIEAGVSPRQVWQVERMNRFSGWKRSPGEVFPVDGGITGGLRK